MYTPKSEKPRMLSVSQLNFYIKSLIENDPRLSVVFVAGEISNLTDHYRSGHIYLSLKDEKSVIRAVMFAGNARSLRFKPQDGMKVICRGRVALYEPTGQYQLYIEDMQPDGVGALALEFEQLKKSLAEKGLFAKKHKKPIPEFPRSIGVITSPTGAAVQDIRNILSRRFPCADLVMCPVLVQGSGAAAQLVGAIKKLDLYNACDVIIIGRGGGSAEDLWVFNSEELAYAIYNCKIPVISAVGHETDFTICDFVSDLRAPTPSAAAELAVPDREELKAYFFSQKQYLNSMISLKLKQCSAQLSQLKAKHLAASPINGISDYENSVRFLQKSAQSGIKEFMNKAESEFALTISKLEALNPVSILSKGYSAVQKDGKRISAASQLNEGDVLSLRFFDGTVNAKVVGDLQ